MDEPFQPSPARLVTAFLLAPLLAALAMAAFFHLSGAGDPRFSSPGPLLWGLAYAFYGAYPPALLLGVPAWLLLRRRARPTLANSASVGALIAGIPWGVILLSSRTPDLRMLGTFAILLAAGALGGAIFWLIAVGPRRRAFD